LPVEANHLKKSRKTGMAPKSGEVPALSAPARRVEQCNFSFPDASVAADHFRDKHIVRAALARFFRGEVTVNPGAMNDIEIERRAFVFYLPKA
jgi:hypothetical protein